MAPKSSQATKTSKKKQPEAALNVNGGEPRVTVPEELTTMSRKNGEERRYESSFDRRSTRPIRRRTRADRTSQFRKLRPGRTKT